MLREERQSDWNAAHIGARERQLRQTANACDARERQRARIIAAATGATLGWIPLARCERRRCWDTQQVVRSQNFLQMLKILFALLQGLRDPAAIELVRQFETRSYVGAKFRLSLSDPRPEGTVDLRPLNHAERVGVVREAFAIGSQVAQRDFPNPVAKQIAQSAHRLR